ncbi:helicase-related protein [Kallotenue papyrolyticum]|uniref:helicase-related protein n=1 Tax=Kallotenue papyrolyticum TaxID=1325125 RepID=UPI0004785D85|nr:helicase-related protein [Kallotenue papyrolyticum]
MAHLEDLKQGLRVAGILPDQPVTIIDVTWRGNAAVELTYKDATGRLGQELLYRDAETRLMIVEDSQPWSFEADGGLLRLVAEAKRIRLAYLFDPRLAVHTSQIEPLPHQITAVYGEMLPRQPLRFLLADDPGAGKTIMAGLLIKELMLRGDVQRCLIVCPGSLVEQWQDELQRRFHLPFEILTNDKLETARTGNWFTETPLVICRLDRLSRDEDVQLKLEQVDWDLVICDEAHKMSASYNGGEIRYTKRYRLGQRLARQTRHLLLLTATPHNGKEEDFQLFMQLLDPDRFEGRYRAGVHTVDVSDLMRRLVKEQLVRFDGRPLFPERRAATLAYALSPAEMALYDDVTAYVRHEWDRAEKLAQPERRGTVGFALTALQRRLASSPAAIHASLRRRRERLEQRLAEAQQRRETLLDEREVLVADTETDLWETLEDAPPDEVERQEEELVDRATAATTIAELAAEIDSLRDLEAAALQVLRSGEDRKWTQLSDLLQNAGEMFDAQGQRRKLVIFTEHRDTLRYLEQRISTLLGRPEAVVTIHGGMRRDERRRAQEEFTQNPEVRILIATDAAGEGINLQRAHLMVNYDLPWNPNRLEQRFGRIHRIGQTEVCHLWNLVAANTREGEVYYRLLRKLEAERAALGGQVFDVLGRLSFDHRPLRELLIEAIRYGERPEVRRRLEQVVDASLDTERLRALLQERALAHDALDAAVVQQVREEMERAEARRLQPHFIAAFFLEAFRQLGGSIREREPRRYEISYVPAAIRNQARLRSPRDPVLQRYERITFEKDLLHVPDKPPAAFVCPGHPLLEAVIDLILERHGALLRMGAVLVDPNDPGEELRALSIIEHAIQDARTDASGQRRIVSRQMQFVEIDTQGRARTAGYAPYLDYRPLTEDERAAVQAVVADHRRSHDLEREAINYAIATLVPAHLEEVRRFREALIDKTKRAVYERLTKEIIYWNQRAWELEQQEHAGKKPTLNSARARQRAEELDARLQRRMEELEQERRLAALPPNVIGGALIVPAGRLRRLMGQRESPPELFAHETKRVERLAMEAVLAAEQRLGYAPRDVSADKCGYDVESRNPTTGRLRFLEVKGRRAGAETVTITRNEILTALNKPDDWILALVEVPADDAPVGDAWVRETRETYHTAADCRVRYVHRPFGREPDFGATSVNYDWRELWARGEEV